jgi:DNA-binding response OmpR family regulator
MSQSEGAPTDKIQIGDFRLDLERGVLSKDGRPVPTRARTFALLAFLARNARLARPRQAAPSMSQ